MKTKIFLTIAAATCLLTACKEPQDGDSTPKKQSSTTSISTTESAQTTESVAATEKTTTVSTDTKTVTKETEKESPAITAVTVTTAEHEEQSENLLHPDTAIAAAEPETTAPETKSPELVPDIPDELKSDDVEYPDIAID